MRWQLGQWSFEKKYISKLMMSKYSEMKVGNEVVLQVFVEIGSLHCMGRIAKQLRSARIGKGQPKTLSDMGRVQAKTRARRGQLPPRDKFHHARSQTPIFPTWRCINRAQTFCMKIQGMLHLVPSEFSAKMLGATIVCKNWRKKLLYRLGCHIVLRDA